MAPKCLPVDLSKAPLRSSASPRRVLSLLTSVRKFSYLTFSFKRNTAATRAATLGQENVEQQSEWTKDAQSRPLLCKALNEVFQQLCRERAPAAALLPSLSAAGGSRIMYWALHVRRTHPADEETWPKYTDIPLYVMVFYDDETCMDHEYPLSRQVYYLPSAGTQLVCVDAAMRPVYVPAKSAWGVFSTYGKTTGESMYEGQDDFDNFVLIASAPPVGAAGMAQLQQAQEMGFPLQKEELWVKFTQYYFEKRFVSI